MNELDEPNDGWMRETEVRTPYHPLAVGRHDLRLAVEDEAKCTPNGNESERLERCIEGETAHP